MKTPISYYGGKQTLLKYILPLIPEHTTYTEAFCGGCAVFFAKNAVDCEVINDLNNELINFYEVTKDDYELLNAEIQRTLHSRDSHHLAHFVNMNPHHFDKIKRAWAIWVLSKMSFASKLNGTFGYDRNGTTSKKIDNAKCNFTHEISERLRRVTIENEDGTSLIKRYDSVGAFHFVDPPYIGTNCGHYSDSFNLDDFIRLLNVLSKVQGKFMLTMFPNSDIEKFATEYNWTIKKVQRTITAAKSNSRVQQEWIVTNY